ncbi:MAG: hypothetical protein EOP07_11040 [Proteobacteria bacterium]|nr:MAG: hypothetical protein EOP07_11040 [Pseudomonadota bacterium]
MTTKSIAKDDWKHYLDDYSKSLQSTLVELDVESLELGDQIEADWVHLKGISYDPKDDMLYIFTEALRHFIAKPRNIWVVEGSEGPSAIQIEDGEGTKHIVNLRLSDDETYQKSSRSYRERSKDLGASI